MGRRFFNCGAGHVVSVKAGTSGPNFESGMFGCGQWHLSWCPPGADAHIDGFDHQGKCHGEIDVAFADVLVEAFGDEHDADED